MKCSFYKYFFVIVLLITFGCARRGSIDGGKKDTIAPVLKMSFPKNGSVNFSSKEIKLTFNEYVKLKDLEKQLIVSPPMTKTPQVSPTNPSKNLTIELKEELLPNTTYSFNFGQSIEDNNENNAYKQFKYVFSTGSYIDSLSIGGAIKDAFDKKVDNYVSIMLYEVNDKYKDSIVYTQKPRYITNTLDSLKVFRIENVKAGKYLLVAVKDKNGNNKFDSRTEKIGFQKQFVTIPNDTTFQLELFKEDIPFKALKPKQSSGNRIILPFEGNSKNLKVVLKNGSSEIKTIITKFEKKDSVQVWFEPIKADSLKLLVSKEKYSENFEVKMKAQKNDTLSFNALQNGNLNFRETFTIHASNPISKIDNSKIVLLNKDSVAIKFDTKYEEFTQDLTIDFKKEAAEKYKLKLFPGAMIDYLANKNDTLKFNVTTKNLTDYGNLTVVLENVNRFPLIVELTDDKGKIYATEFVEKLRDVDFNLIEPSKYTLRIIYDDNKNQEFDAGNFLEKRQSEEVYYHPKEIDVRANWDVNESINFKR